MAKSDVDVCYNQLILISLCYFSVMVKKFAFSVAVKSRRKMAFLEANSVTNAMFAVVVFRQENKFF